MDTQDQAANVENGTVKEDKEESGRKKKPVVLIIILILAGLLLIAGATFYFMTANYYKTHFFPNVTINNADCSYMDASAVISVIEQQSRNYAITVFGQDHTEIGVLTAEDLGFAIDIEKDVADLLAGQKWLQWPRAYWSAETYSVIYEISFDSEKLRSCMGTWEALQPSNMEEPQDAYLTEYLPDKKAYEIIPETRGSLLDREKAFEAVNMAVQAGNTTVDLEEAGCYIRAKITSEDSRLQKRAEELNRIVSTQIIYDWNGTEVILDGDTIKDWISEENGKITIDEDAVAEFVKVHAKQNDTYGKTRKFTTVQGITLSLASGAYGWRTDQQKEVSELLELIKAGARESREPVYKNKAAKKGITDDIGDSYVEIDLSNQHLYFFMDGVIILESDFVSGDMSNGNVTPPGVFGLTYKTTNAVLRGANYETPVNYWMPFNGNVGMHDATWRSEFGGDIFLTDGSHGCVNLPLDKAKEIYSYLPSKGFPIICYYY